MVPDVHFNALTNEQGKSEGIAILMQRRALDGKVRSGQIKHILLGFVGEVHLCLHSYRSTGKKDLCFHAFEWDIVLLVGFPCLMHSSSFAKVGSVWAERHPFLELLWYPDPHYQGQRHHQAWLREQQYNWFHQVWCGECCKRGWVRSNQDQGEAQRKLWDNPHPRIHWPWVCHSPRRHVHHWIRHQTAGFSSQGKGYQVVHHRGAPKRGLKLLKLLLRIYEFSLA